MSQLASMALLSGGKKDAVGAELAKPTTTETPASTDTVLDPDTATAEELDAALKSESVTPPQGWDEWELDAKRSWIKTTFGADAATDASPPEAPVPVQVEGSPKTLLPGASADEAEQPKTKAKAKSKAKAKGTEIVPSDVKNGEVVEPDVLQDMVHEIENLKEQQALQMIDTLTEQTEVTFFKLGGILSSVQGNGWYKPYATFKEFVEQKHGLHYRKAIYWIEIYNRLSSSGVPWAKVSKVGWTKLKEIARVITVENVDEWVAIAEKETTLTLIETVKAALAKDSPTALEDQTAKTVTTITFKAHEGQKETIKAAVAKAKEQSGTAVDTVALENICSDYLSGMTLEQRCAATTWQKWLEVFEKVHPTIGIEVDPTTVPKAAAE